MNDIRICKKNNLFVSKLFVFKHAFISVTFLILPTVIGKYTKSEFSTHSNYRGRQQSLSEPDSIMNLRNNFERIFHSSYHIANENNLRSCYST